MRTIEEILEEMDSVDNMIETYEFKQTIYDKVHDDLVDLAIQYDRPDLDQDPMKDIISYYEYNSNYMNDKIDDMKLLNSTLYLEKMGLSTLEEVEEINTFIEDGGSIQGLNKNIIVEGLVNILKIKRRKNKIKKFLQDNE